MKLVNGNVTATPEQYLEFIKGLASENPIDNELFDIVEVREGVAHGCVYRVVTFSEPIQLVGAPMSANPVDRVMTRTRITHMPKNTAEGEYRKIDYVPIYFLGEDTFDMAQLKMFFAAFISGGECDAGFLPVESISISKFETHSEYQINLEKPLRVMVGEFCHRVFDRLTLVLDTKGWPFNDEYQAHSSRWVEPYGIDPNVPFRVISETMLSDALVTMPTEFLETFETLQRKSWDFGNENLAEIFYRQGDEVSQRLGDFLNGHYMMGPGH